METTTTTHLANQSDDTERGVPYNDFESRARRRSSDYRQDGPDRDEPLALAPRLSISRDSGGFLVMPSLVQDSVAGQRSSQASIQNWLDAEPPIPPSLTTYSDESLVRPRSSMDQDGPDRKHSMAPQSQDSGSGSSSASSTPTPSLNPLAGQQGWQSETEDLVDAETWHRKALAASAIPPSSTTFGGSSPSASSSITLVGEDTRSRLSSYSSQDGSVTSISTARRPRDSADGAYLGTIVPSDCGSAESGGAEPNASNGVASGLDMQGLPSHGADVASCEASGGHDKGKKRADVEHEGFGSDQDSDFFRQRKRMRGNDDERYYAARKTLRTVLYGAARAHEQGDDVVESLDAIARIFDLERALHHERMMKCSLLSQLQMTQKQVEERDQEIEEHKAFWLEDSMEDDTESGSSGEQDEDQHSNFSVAGSVQELDEDENASEDGRVINVFL
ncbi:hypothetical protein EWM64_g7397 [Hericium alpestre]|uniref:Uncharacterized protein n=1 Tax=Hericium alpestre TaxID=135208 RepID=A0A4Y9ZRF8_9AGAM|nr:hypothetical protein EWM64_g7397 [Hericium alpestre]